MINIYYPIELYDPTYRGHLFPLLKPFIKGKGFNDGDRVKMYHISNSEIQIVDDLDKAEEIILPMSWNYYVENNKIKIAKIFIEEIKKTNKKVFSFTNGDFGVRIPKLDNLVVLRPSGEQLKLDSNHRGIPSFIDDPLKKHFKSQEIYIREYATKPVIGFCGQTNASVLNALKEIIRTSFRNFKCILKLSNDLPQKIQSTTWLRSKVLSKIKKTKLLEANFIERTKYRAGATSNEQKKKTTMEFYSNINESDYTVCVRGAGNFSVRLYETLAMGRIPIFINTDCILPLADNIDWKKHMVWIEENEINRLEEKVLDFHSNLNHQEFENLQHSNRKLWKEKLTLGGFFKTILNE